MQNVANYLSELVKICAKQKCYNILLEEYLEGPGLDTIDIFDIISKASIQRTIGLIAYVDANQDHGIGTMKFAENVAVNRGVNVRIFSSVSKAQKWIENQLSDQPI